MFTKMFFFLNYNVEILQYEITHIQHGDILNKEPNGIEIIIKYL